MKKIITISIYILFTSFFACKTYTPFSSRKEKNIAVLSIKKQLDIDKQSLKILKKNDSLIFDINNSLKSSVKIKLIERRIDSFINKKYSLKEFKLLLQIDREFPNEIPMEFIRDSSNIKTIKIKDVKELKKTIKKIDASIDKSIKIINKKDSIK